MAEEDNEAYRKSSNRWWEYYFVRYFIGTVIGVAVIIIMNSYQESALHTKIFEELSKYDSTSHAIMLVVLGLSYCYIASAPMLTFHVLRYSVQVDSGSMFNWKKYFSTVLAFFVLLKLIGFTIDFDLGWKDWKTWSFSIVALISAYQWVGFLATALIEKNREKMFDYYHKLCRARTHKIEARMEFTESYRHLREHANAYAIIVLEIALALPLLATTRIEQFAFVIILWVAPASLSWVLGSYLESRLHEVELTQL